MDTPFNYNRFVVGNDFLSRKKELNILTNLLRQGQHALIYDAPKTGKKSLVQQTFLNLQKLSYDFKACNINLFNIRSKDVLFRTIASQIASSVSNTLDEWNSFHDKYFTFPEEGPLTDKQIEDIIALPELIAKESGINYIIYFEEFQNILLIDDYDKILKLFDKLWREHTMTTYLITGSQINAMKNIFEEQKFFYNFAEYIPLSPLEEKSVIDYITRTFLKVGRVVDQELAQNIYHSLSANPWYIWHLSTICFNLTKGYLNDKIIQEGMISLLSLHEPRFKQMVYGLSNYQISFLKAIFDGVTRFSSNEILEKYHFNSSANVHRLKDALKKKEIVTFDDNDIPSIIDPLFKIWLKKYYFVQ